MKDLGLDSEDASSPQDIKDGFSLDERQKKIWEGLIKKDKRLGDIYFGSLQLLADKSNHSRLVLAAHGLRTLGWLFRGTAPAESQSITIEKAVRKLLKKVGKKGTITYDELLKCLPTQDGGGHRALIKQNIIQADPLGGSSAALVDELSKRWVNNLQAWFTDISKGLKTQISEEEFAKKLHELEDILFSILIPHFDIIAAIDRLLPIPHPKEQDILFLKSLLAKGWSSYSYFFGKADINWLAPLAEGQLFLDPSKYQRWPASMYLAKMASKKPRQVMKIIESCPTTANQWVHDDFVQAAMNMPSGIGVKIIPIILLKGWLKTPNHTLLTNKVAEFMVKLAGENKIKEALTLARMLLDVVLDKKRSGSKVARSTFGDDWHYKTIIEEKMDQLTLKAPKQLISIFSKNLEKALEIEDRGSKKSKTFDEYSYIWRPSLEVARMPDHEDVKNVLIDGILSVIQFVGENDPSKLRAISAIIRKHTHPIFRRIELHFYRLFPSIFPNEIRRLLTDDRAINAISLRREYLALLKDHFAGLSKSSQNKILKVINDGFALKKTEDWGAEEFEAAKTNLQLIYLEPIVDQLPDELRDWYGKMTEKYGKPRDDRGGMTSWSGPNSPVSTEDLGQKTAEDIIEYLATWIPPKERFAGPSPSPEGLGRSLQTIVAQRSAEFSSVAELFLEKKVRPVYIYHLFYGLKESLKNNSCFDWDSIIVLCSKIIRLSDYSSFPKPHDNFEPSWSAVRKSMIDLIGDGLATAHCNIPFELRESILEIIKVISDDEDPTPEYEKEYGGDNMDPVSLSINTVRGEAMHTAMKYALWCSRKLYPGKTAPPEGQPRLVPEVREVLDKHLDPLIDPSPTIRSVYGLYLPQLFYLDKDWVIKNQDNIFPKDPSNDHLWLAAWEAYLSNDITRNLFLILKEQYRRSISLLGTSSKKGHKYADLNQLLPQHLMIIFAHESSYDDLLDEFFDTAPPEARGEAINFAGRAILRKQAGEISADTVQKFETLWGKRLNVPEEKRQKEELKQFGWWFVRNPFKREWVMKQLVRTLEITEGKIEPDHQIPEELTRYVDDFPIETIKALSLIAHGDAEGWEITSNQEEYRMIIQKAMVSGNPEAKQIATDLIHYLGQRQVDYSDLLT